MKKGKEILKVCAVLLAFLCVAQVGAAATVDVDKVVIAEKINQTHNERFVSFILRAMLESGGENNSTLSNATKQLIRVLLFCGIMFYVLNPKIKKHVLKVTLQGGKTRVPLKFQISDKLVLLGVAAVLAVSIYMHMEKGNGTSNETENETQWSTMCSGLFDGMNHPMLDWLLGILERLVNGTVEIIRFIIEQVRLLFGENPEPIQ